MKGDLQNILSTEPLDSYYQVVQWSIVRLMLIFQFILFFQSQSIDLKNAFDQADIPTGEPVFI